MIAGLTALVLLAQAGQDAVAEVDRLRDERRFSAALGRSAAIADDATRHRARLNVMYYGGDLAAALSEARAGLEHEPDDPWLLYYGTRLALDLGRVDAGAELAESLSRTVLEGSLSEDVREFYAAESEAFGARLGELQAARDRRSSAVFRARAVVLGAFAASLAALFLLSRAGPSRRKSPSISTS